MNGSSHSAKTQSEEPHVPWSQRRKPIPKDKRRRHLVNGRDGHQYNISINGNGMIGVQRIIKGRIERGDYERLRYADEVLKWMEDSAKAANQVPFVPPPKEQP